MMQVKQSTWKTWSMAVHPVPSPTTFSPQRAQRPERKEGLTVKNTFSSSKEDTMGDTVHLSSQQQQQAHHHCPHHQDHSDHGSHHEASTVGILQTSWGADSHRQGPMGSDQVELRSSDVEANALPLISHRNVRETRLRMVGVESTAFFLLGATS